MHQLGILRLLSRLEQSNLRSMQFKNFSHFFKWTFPRLKKNLTYESLNIYQCLETGFFENRKKPLILIAYFIVELWQLFEIF